MNKNVRWTKEELKTFLDACEAQCVSTERQIVHPNFGSELFGLQKTGSISFFQGQVDGKRYILRKLKELLDE